MPFCKKEHSSVRGRRRLCGVGFVIVVHEAILLEASDTLLCPPTTLAQASRIAGFLALRDTFYCRYRPFCIFPLCHQMQASGRRNRLVW
eukprot:c35061_g1_i1 orf=57-323(+)